MLLSLLIAALGVTCCHRLRSRDGDRLFAWPERGVQPVRLQELVLWPGDDQLAAIMSLGKQVHSLDI